MPPTTNFRMVSAVGYSAYTELITNTSFEENDLGWTLSGFSRFAEASPDGTHTLIASVWAGDPVRTAVSNKCACLAGVTLGVSFLHRSSVYGMNNVGGADVKIKFYNSSNTLLQTRTILTLFPYYNEDSGWQRFSTTLTAAPAGSSYATLTATLTPDGAPSGALLTMHMDAVSIMSGSYGTPTAPPIEAWPLIPTSPVVQYPRPTRKDGYGRPAGIVGLPWSEFGRPKIVQTGIDWYNALFPTITSESAEVKCKLYDPRVGQWLIYKGILWRPSIGKTVSGKAYMFADFKVVISELVEIATWGSS